MKRAIRVAGALALSAILAGCVASSKYNKLMAEQTALQEEQTKLKTQLDAMTAENGQLKTAMEKARADSAAMAEERARLQAESQQAKAAVENTTSRYDTMLTALKSEVEAGNIKVKQYQNILTVDVAEKLFFDSGSATLKKTGQDVLKKVAGALGDSPDKMIRVMGHTDNVPLAKGAKFPTNWELSVARATNVVRFFQDQCKIDPRRLIASGRGEFSPVASNDTPDGRQQNRRIEIAIIDRSLVETTPPPAADQH